MTGHPPAPDLEHLLGSSALRDRRAFAELYRTTSAKLFAVILRIVKQEGVAEETLQDVYLKVWDRAGDYQAGRGQPMTWLISIARYRAIDVLRAQQRQPAVSATLLEDLPAESSPGPCQAAEQVGERGDLDDCLGQLPDQRRTCLYLAYCEGYTHQELSKRLDSPVGTIKSWIRRSLLLVRECLEALHG